MSYAIEGSYLLTVGKENTMSIVSTTTVLSVAEHDLAVAWYSCSDGSLTAGRWSRAPSGSSPIRAM
jgi:hypothetical protein